MSRRIPIQLNTANALQLLGTLYRSPADAIKEHISNALDEHLRAQQFGRAQVSCPVIFTLEKDRVAVEYPYGMDKNEFEEVLARVANSIKKSLDVTQIGQLGIGVFSFLQIGKKCVLLTRKAGTEETVKVTLSEGSDKADFETAIKKERLAQPGIKIEIRNLRFDPTRPRGPLSPERLEKVFSEKFDQYLRQGVLSVKIISKGRSYDVKPMKIELAKLGAQFRLLHLAKDFSKGIGLELYFDPLGKAKVGIRHTGVVVVEDIKQLQAYGLEESVFAGGYVKGFIDADFLKPLPARGGFDENEDWISLLDELYKLTPSIEAEVEILKQQEAEKKLTEIQKKAIEIASEILNMDEFRDLQTLEGLGRKPREGRRPPNGFDFVPESVRANVNERSHLVLKADVPGRVASGTSVTISVSHPSAVALETKEVTLKEEDATEGVVSARIYFKGTRKLATPAIVTASAVGVEREPQARIMLGESGPSRTSRTAGEEGREGQRFNYVEKPFEGELYT